MWGRGRADRHVYLFAASRAAIKEPMKYTRKLEIADFRMQISDLVRDLNCPDVVRSPFNLKSEL